MGDYLGLLGQGAILGFGVAAPLGPTGATAIRRGLAFGGWAAFWVGIGAALTDFFYIVLTWLGVVPIITRVPALEPVLYLAGALVLGRMGWGAVREGLAGGMRPPSEVDAATLSSAAVTWRAMLLLGITVTVVNPATITSWLSVGGAFVAGDLVERSFPEALGAMLAIFVGSAAWFTILATLVGVMRSSIGRLPWLFRAVGIASGLMLLGFALLFGWRGAAAVLG